MSNIKRHYGLNKDLKTIELGYENAFDALKIIDDRFNNQKDFYEWIEESIADTMFGFGDDGGENEFVEICLMGKHPNSFKFEYTRRKIDFILFKFPLFSSYEIEYKSIEIMKDKVAQFFKRSPIEFAESMIQDGAKKV